MNEIFVKGMRDPDLKEGKYEKLMCFIGCTLKCDPMQFVDFQYYGSLDGLLAMEF